MLSKLVAQRCFHAAAGKPSVGFVGLGCMGKHMSKNLLKNGYAVKGYDISPDTEKFCSEAGIQHAKSVADVSKNVDFIVTCLPATAHVESVLKGDGGILANANKGTTICDVSTIAPTGSVQFYKDA